MPQLTARLLGPPRVEVNGRVLALGSSKAAALLYYLLATRQVHSRNRLAGFCWPDYPERSALASLRTALYEIRRALGPEADAILFVERTRVAIVATAIDLDIQVVEATSAESGQPTEAADSAAVEIYAGEFLQGVSLADAYDYDDWVFLERERLAGLVTAAIGRTADRYAARGEYGLAVGLTRRILATDPLREDMHRALMEYLARSGQRTAALAQYQTCADLLAKELGIEPLAPTKELFERLLAGDALPGGPPVTVVPAVARAASRRRALAQAIPRSLEVPAPTLVGRRAELGQLQAAWRRALHGDVQLLLVEGEAGIGKSRLILDFTTDLTDANLMTGRCFESTAHDPFAPVSDALRRSMETVESAAASLPEVWRSQLARLAPEVASSLGTGIPDPLDGDRDRERVFESVRAFLKAAAAERPVVMVIEDAQWSDETSLALLAYLARSGGLGPCLIIVTCRSDELNADRRTSLAVLAALGTRLALEPLGPDNMADLVAAFAGTAAAPAAFGAALARRTGGNPFFAIETLRALFELGVLAVEDGVWTTVPSVADDGYSELPVPSNVGLLVDSRLAPLGDDARLLLEVAAVLRRDFTFDLVQAASGLAAPVALDALDALLSRRLLSEGASSGTEAARYDFVHALVRDRVYTGLSGARRQYLHRQIAGCLEVEEPVQPERVAYHYTRGGVRSRAHAWSLQAGRAALAMHAAVDAGVHFRSALELAAGAAEESAALTGLGDAAVGCGRPGDAIAFYGQALQHSRTDDERAELHRRLGRAHERQGVFDAALDAYATARSLLQPGPASLAKVRVVDGLATVYVRLGRHEEAAELCRDALAWLATHRDMPEAGQAESWLRNTYGMALVHLGDFGAAAQQLARSLELRRSLGDRLGEATLLNNLGVVHYRRGDDEAARDCYAASLAIKEDIGDGYGRAIALTNLALMETHLGASEAAAQHLAAAEIAAGDVRATWLMPEIRRVAAQRAMAVGDNVAALAAAEGSLVAAEELGVPAFIGVAHRVLGMVRGRLDDAPASEEHFMTSLAVFEMLGDEHEEAKTHAAYAQVLADLGRQEDALGHLRQARRVFERTGAFGRLARLPAESG